MDLSPILNPLNDAQRAAVTAPLGPVLVLAGAGSGKTRALTHRLARLIQAEGVAPHRLLAVAFTNKAAGALPGRVRELGRRGLRGAAAARLRAVARQPRAPFALPAALPARAGR